MKKRILFLMSDTGGGHRAAACAIEEAIHYLYPNAYDIFIEDIWKTHTPWPINKIPNYYPWLTGPGLPLWRLMWSSSTRFPAHKIVFPSISPVVERTVMGYLKAIAPDTVVSVHPFMNHLGLKWLDKINLQIPFVTVVTDLVTIHPMWICPRVTRCFVPTPAARDFAIEWGMPPEKIDICGQPISLKFAMLTDDKQTVRQRLELDCHRRVVLVMGGGEGFGHVFEIARAIAQSVSPAQLLIVAGRNRALRERLETIAWEIPTRIYGFVENIPEFMKAADILITKAGPGTISEAFAMGLPLIISGYIPGQEQGNVTYVLDHKAGTYAETPEAIAELVSIWLAPDNDLLQIMACNAARLAKPKASLAIAEKICCLI